MGINIFTVNTISNPPTEHIAHLLKKACRNNKAC